MNKPVKAQLGVLSRLIASQPKAPNPTGDSRVLTPEIPETKPIIESFVRQSAAKIASHYSILDHLFTHDPTISLDHPSLLLSLILFSYSFFSFSIYFLFFLFLFFFFFFFF